MCQIDQQTGHPLDLTQAQIIMRCALVGASILMAILIAIGGTVTITAGGELDGHLVAYGGGLAAFVGAWIMVIGIGALAVNLAVFRHQRAIEKRLTACLAEIRSDIAVERKELAAQRTELNRRLDEIEDQHERLDALMDRVSKNQETEAKILGHVIEGKVRTIHAHGN